MSFIERNGVRAIFYYYCMFFFNCPPRQLSSGGPLDATAAELYMYIYSAIVRVSCVVNAIQHSHLTCTCKYTRLYTLTDSMTAEKLNGTRQNKTK